MVTGVGVLDYFELGFEAGDELFFFFDLLFGAIRRKIMRIIVHIFQKSCKNNFIKSANSELI